MSEEATANSALPIDVPDDKVKQLKQEILASGLLDDGTLLAETLQQIIDQPDPVIYQTKIHQVFTQLRDEVGAEVLIVEGDILKDVEGKQIICDDGQKRFVISAEYHADKDWTFIRFPASPLGSVRSISVFLLVA